MPWSDFKPQKKAIVESAIRELKNIVPEIKKECIEIQDIETEIILNETPRLNQFNNTTLAIELPHTPSTSVKHITRRIEVTETEFQKGV